MPRTHRTVACIVVRSAKAFAPLGKMPAMNWAVRQLLDVRGVDRVECVADARLRERAAKLLAKDGIDVTALPAAVVGTQKTERDLDLWLCSASGPAAEADVVLVFRPTSPFLPKAKIEAVLHKVSTKLADFCCTAREVNAYVRAHAAAGAGWMIAHAEVATCRAFAPARVSERAASRFAPVPLDLIESLDVSVPDNLRVATALVSSKAV